MRTSTERLCEAGALMGDFAARTGLTGGGPPRRYLWTDAFAVCNLLGLADATGDGHWHRLALDLVDQVHHVLGRHRPDDPREGWLSGLDEEQGAEHPTQAGLRIGKSLPERGENEPFDERLEWERDGQYFHYLTRWMHALACTARATRDARYVRWGRELAVTAVARFSHAARPATRPRLSWKMSIDLSRALVPSTGQHDPLDGYVACRELEATALVLEDPADAAELAGPIEALAGMIDPRGLASADALGLGGLLLDAAMLSSLLEARPGEAEEALLDATLAAAVPGLDHHAHHPPRGAAARRLAFRELGLAIGLDAVERTGGTRAHERFTPLARYLPLRDTIVSFWRDAGHRHGPAWSAHRDINEVMLATSLAPAGYVSAPGSTG